MKTWFEMTEAEKQALAMATLNEVMAKEERAEKRRAAKAKKMQQAAKDFCNINTIDKMEFNTIVTYNF